MNKLPGDPQTSQWHLDKRVNVSIITMLAFQLIGGAWFAATLNAAVQSNREDIIEIQGAIATMRVQRDDLVGRMIRVEEKIGQQNRTLETQTRTLEKILEAVSVPR